MKLEIFIILFFIWVIFIKEDTIHYGKGVIAPNTPIQTTTDKKPFDFKGYTITPLRYFKIEAKVLSKERYRFDSGSELSPMDLVLGWGHMSDKDVLKDIKISQNGRWYYWSTDHFPIPRREIETHSANMHMIPANKEIENMLYKIDKGALISLEGYLVSVDKPDGYYWKSSLTRDDTGAHACEVVFVTNLTIIDKN